MSTRHYFSIKKGNETVFEEQILGNHDFFDDKFYKNINIIIYKRNEEQIMNKQKDILSFAKHIIAVANENDIYMTIDQLCNVMYQVTIQGFFEKLINIDFCEKFSSEISYIRNDIVFIQSVYDKFQKYENGYILKKYKQNPYFKNLNDLILTKIVHQINKDLIEEIRLHELLGPHDTKTTIGTKRDYKKNPLTREEISNIFKTIHKGGVHGGQK